MKNNKTEDYVPDNVPYELSSYIRRNYDLMRQKTRICEEQTGVRPWLLETYGGLIDAVARADNQIAVKALYKYVEFIRKADCETILASSG